MYTSFINILSTHSACVRSLVTLHFTESISGSRIPHQLLRIWKLIEPRIGHICAAAGSKGYSFATWMRLESVDSKSTSAGRSLFTLLHKTSDGTRGVSAAIKGAAHVLVTLWRC